MTTTHATTAYEERWKAAMDVLSGFHDTRWIPPTRNFPNVLDSEDGMTTLAADPDQQNSRHEAPKPVWGLSIVRWPTDQDPMNPSYLGRIPRTQAGLAADVATALPMLQALAKEMHGRRHVARVKAMLTEAKTGNHRLDEAMHSVVRGWGLPLVGAAVEEFERLGRESGNRYTTSIDDALTTIPEGMVLRSVGTIEDPATSERPRFAQIMPMMTPIWPPGGPAAGWRSAQAPTIPLAICIASLDAMLEAPALQHGY